MSLAAWKAYFGAAAVDDALDKTFQSMRIMTDFHRDLCKAGIHPDSLFHPVDCPERPAAQAVPIPAPVQAELQKARVI